MSGSSDAPPALATDSVMVISEFDPTGRTAVRGFDFEAEAPTLDNLAQSMKTMGFQATNVGLAIDEINKMLAWRLSDRPVKDTDSDEVKDPEYRANKRATIFLSYTSNLISSGMRETFKYLCKHNLVDCIVTTAGGIEEDFMKCLAPHFLGDFKLKGKDLRKNGVNRLANLLVPNNNYVVFEEWLVPILHAMTDEQLADPENVRWTPSKMIHRLGKEINNEDSVYYWCYKNNIPVFCPAITDGSIGDMLYFHSYKRPELYVDIVQDIKAINDIAVRADCTGMVILGGGLIKHHTCNANLMRNGADYAVYVNTAHEFDGSDSGASPDEAISWGKIKIDSTAVKVSADVTLVFPLIVSQTFYKEHLKRQQESVEKKDKK
jgi:deoxyhypusine synthase